MTTPHHDEGTRTDEDARTDEAARTTDAERPDYSVDQIGDDQTPADTTLSSSTNDRATTDDRVDTAPSTTDRVVADSGPNQPVDDTRSTSERADDNSDGVRADEPLVATDEAVDFKARWDVIQQNFVDDPRTAVTDADKLVSDVLERLSATFDRQHRDLEGQWSDGEPDTEALRSALQRYRAFFERLLTI